MLAPEGDVEAPIDAEAPPEGGPMADEALEPEVEVGDTKIALSPEQWGQVLATSDLLNGGGEPESVEDLGAEGDAEIPAEGGEGEVAELARVHNLDNGKVDLQVGAEDEKEEDDDTQHATVVTESFNEELAGYADALRKLISE
jgi:hypothetical protein